MIPPLPASQNICFRSSGRIGSEWNLSWLSLVGGALPKMDSRIPYDDYPVVFLPAYENPPAWIPPHELGFNIRGGKASQLGIFISKVIPDSDAHRAGLQEGDQVLAVNDVDFQDIEHSKAVEILKTAREISMRVRFFPYNYHRQKERTVH
ncbi:PDZ domain-containing protein 11 isoform X2 [Artibeus jamaicensis]|uniref:PDZ domain-containing protein 11 isoform X2 n=1 Tax=Artibeus jamaicensis TaxID=9417 RepID=UPI00235A7742|nr:PDZ domain-containing protein 11 isoform X2 [Artibeus jamaicensis]